MIRKKRHNRHKTNKVVIPQNRINRQINNAKVQLVGHNVEEGIYSVNEAIQIAEAQELDLVEMTVSSKGISICKVLDYNKVIFEKKKKNKEMKLKNKKMETKEIRLTPNTDEHDFDFKAKHAKNFLSEGHKVKIMLQFKGRNIIYKDRGVAMINKLVDSLSGYGVVEENISQDRRRMNAIVAPIAKK